MRPQPTELLPLHLNGLTGRELRLATTKTHRQKQEFVLVYGLHTSIERMYAIAQKVSEFGNVSMPDLPGFDGMSTFYSIGQRPTIDAYADYLAAYIRLRFKGKPIQLVGFSFGFCVVTRMLQKYPDLRPSVKRVYSFVGILHKDGFIYSKRRTQAYLLLMRFCRTWLGSLWYRYFCVNSFFIRLFYPRTKNARHKFKDTTPEMAKAYLDFEIRLWHDNDIRTWGAVLYDMFHMNLTEPAMPIDLYHLEVRDQYFNNDVVRQHLSVAYREVQCFSSEAEKHMPSYYTSVKEIDEMLPPGMIRVLERPA